jgi:hypothetical protein
MYDAPQPADGPARTASWIDPPPLHVPFLPEAEAELAGGTYSSSPAQLRRLLVQTLAADPRPQYRWKRARNGSDGAEYDVDVDGWLVRCRFEDDNVDHEHDDEQGGEVVTVLRVGRTQDCVIDILPCSASTHRIFHSGLYTNNSIFGAKRLFGAALSARHLEAASHPATVAEPSRDRGQRGVCRVHGGRFLTDSKLAR